MNQLMYITNPPPERDQYTRSVAADIKLLKNAQGELVEERWPTYGREPRILRDLAGLPLQVCFSSHDHGYLLIGQIDFLERDLVDD